MAETGKKTKAPAKPRAAASTTKKTPARSKKAAPAETIIETVVRVTPTHEEIACLARQYWIDRGHQDGFAEQDWLRAEQELATLAS